MAQPQPQADLSANAVEARAPEPGAPGPSSNGSTTTRVGRSAAGQCLTKRSGAQAARTAIESSGARRRIGRIIAAV